MKNQNRTEINAKLELLQRIMMATEGITAKEAKEKIENEIIQFMLQNI